MSNILYKCNPKINIKCIKTSCQKECFLTTHKEFAKIPLEIIFEKK